MEDIGTRVSAGEGCEVAASRVLLVVRWPIGGIRTFFRYFYMHFDRHRYRFTLVAPALQETQLLLAGMSSLDVEYVSMDPEAGGIRWVSKVSSLIFAGKFDLVHSHGFTANVTAAFAAALKGVPHLVTLHETIDSERVKGWRGISRRQLMTAALNKSTRVHCVTEDARRNLLDYLPGCKSGAERISVIHHGVDARHFERAEPRNLRAELGLDDRSFLIGFLGRFMPEKGFQHLLEAMTRVRDISAGGIREPILLCFSPEDAYFREERVRAGKLGVEDSIRFMPFVPDIAPTIKALDLVVMPSIREAAGLVAMEALASGVPLIASDCIGLRETVRGTPARTVRPGDAKELADAILAEIRSPSRAQASEFALEARARFDVGSRAIELQELMQECLSS